MIGLHLRVWPLKCQLGEGPQGFAMPNNKKQLVFNKARKNDAMALAQLVYDMYKEEKRSKIMNGQNNAQTTSTK